MAACHFKGCGHTPFFAQGPPEGMGQGEKVRPGTFVKIKEDSREYPKSPSQKT